MGWYDYDEMFDAPEGCEVCMRSVDDCICEECPVCKEYGNPECYEGGTCGGLNDVERPAAPGEMTASQRQRYDALLERYYAVKRPKTWRVPSIKSMFDTAPKGDFKWDDGDPGDMHAWCCGEKDCPTQWHGAFYSISMGREGGKRWIEVHRGDQDGDWDIDGIWDERDGDNGKTWREFALYHLSEKPLWEFFDGWARYFLHCAETDTDVLEDCRYWSRDQGVDCFLDAAEDNIKTLETWRKPKAKRKSLKKKK